MSIMMDYSGPSQSLKFISKTILRPGGGARSCHGERTHSSICKEMGTSQRGQRSVVRGQGGPTREKCDGLSFGGFERRQLDARLRRSRVRGQRLHSFMSSRGLIVDHHHLPPAEPDGINDNDRCHVLSNLALHKLNSETGQVIYHHRYFTALFTLI